MNNNMEKYDRQNRTIGVDATKKLVNSTAVIIGLKDGLATETSSKLILSGVSNMILVNDGSVESSDLDTGFYYQEKDIGFDRSTVLKSKLMELNPYAKIDCINFEDINFNNAVIILHDDTLEKAVKINKYCRENKNKFIWIRNRGISGFVFVDALEEHQITDLTGEVIDPVQLASISFDGKVTCAAHNTHDFQSGDFITFSNLIGDNLNFLSDKKWEIKINNINSFQIVDFPEETFNFINGTASFMKQISTINHQSLENQIESPSITGFNQDFDKKIIRYNIDNTLYPVNCWSEEMEEIINKTSDKSIQKVIRASNVKLMPVVSILGSMAANEAIKLITNKFTPVSQWIVYSDESIVPKIKPIIIDNFGLGNLFGTEVKSYIEKKNWLMVGCGAIGCEMLKNLAKLNFATEGGSLYVTDPDHIEHSNLSRQFLFRNKHIKSPKSLVASEMIKDINPNINIQAMTEKMGHDNQSLMDKLAPNLDGVINALDNVQARQYMDEQCFRYCLPLFESGTQGMKGNTQPVIPFVTETYSNTRDPPQEKSFPVCTIKNFPNQPEHTIHWAMDYFDFFKRGPENVNKYLSDGEIFLNSLSGFDRNVAKEDIYKYCVKYKPVALYDFLVWSCDLFLSLYRDQILQLLYSFPEDSLTSEGELFWSKGKRCPKVVEFDLNNELVIDFLESCTHMLAKTCHLDDNFSRDDLKEILISNNYQPYQFKLDEEKKIAKNDEELKQLSPEKENEIELPDEIASENLYPEIFEKDDDYNWHIAFIKAASNLRSLNYGIEISTFDQVKGIAGKIVPAVATTTSIVSGLISMEVLKRCQGFSKIEDYKSWFVNMATNTFVSTDPIEAPMLKFGDVEINSWTKFELNEDITLKKFIEVYEKKFSTKLSMVLYGTSILYADFMASGDMDKLLTTIFTEKYQHNLLQNGAEIIIAPEDDSVELPTIQVNIIRKEESLNL